MLRKKKYIAGLLIAAICMSTVNMQVASATDTNINDLGDFGYTFIEGVDGYATDKNGVNWYYHKLKNNTIRLYGAKECKSYMEIPSELNGFTVSSIGAISRYVDKSDSRYGVEEKKVTKVKIPSTVKEICGYAFNECINLTDIELPSSVTMLREGAFVDTPWYKNQRNSDGLIVINGILIDGKNASGKVTIPSNVNTIKKSAFEGCSNLTKVTIPNSVQSIEDYAFKDCINLTSAKVPSSVTQIGYGIFEGDSKLEIQNDSGNTNSDGLIIANGVLVDGRNASGNVTIPAGVTSIKASAFSNCNNLTGISIPEGITKIEENAFGNCEKLTSVKIPSSVKTIGRGAFINCTKLEKIEIPEGVTTIEQDAFSQCLSLNEVELPSTLTKFGIDVFEFTPWLDNSYNSNGLIIVNNVLINAKRDISGEVTIPSGVKVIAGGAFYCCGKLTSVKIPSSVTMIGDKAFARCEKLSKVELPSSVTSIGENAFDSTTTVTGGSNQTPQVPISTSPATSTKPGWAQNAGLWYYINNDGSKKTSWYFESGYWYYFWGNGQMATSFMNFGRNIYYFNTTPNGYQGVMMTGWVETAGEWYYFDPSAGASNGLMKRGWINDRGTWYYLYDNGIMAHNTTIDGYRVNSNGAWY